MWLSTGPSSHQLAESFSEPREGAISKIFEQNENYGGKFFVCGNLKYSYAAQIVFLCSVNWIMCHFIPFLHRVSIVALSLLFGFDLTGNGWFERSLRCFSWLLSFLD